MAKSKKKKKKKGNSFMDAIHPFISDDRILHIIFDAALAGIAWVAAREALKSSAVATVAAEETQTLVKEQTNK